MSTMFAFGIGLATVNGKGEMLDAYYPAPLARLNAADGKQLLAALESANISLPSGGSTEITLDEKQLASLAKSLQESFSAQATLATKMRGASRPVVLLAIPNDQAPASVAEAYLKLHLLSHRLVKPHEQNLDGIFACLPNLAWTNEGPVDLEELADKQLAARSEGRWLAVKCVDKFPPMTDYVVPSGVRIAHTARVRLGAYIGAGTTIMHEGFVNFNAGTAGTSMIEGRVSAGVFVGEGSDLGGGSSTMGTLSGGGNVVIAVGDNCLIGANAGIGIGLGDRCIVEAGLYVTAGTKVALLDAKGQLVEHVKASQLNGKSDLLFRRNSQTGAVECKTHQSKIELNEALHANN